MPRTRWRPTWRPRTDVNASCWACPTTARTRSGCWSRAEDLRWTGYAPTCSQNSTKASDSGALTHRGTLLTTLRPACAPGFCRGRLLLQTGLRERLNQPRLEGCGHRCRARLDDADTDGGAVAHTNLQRHHR